LNQICKIYKTNQKLENRKGKEIKKEEKAAGKLFGLALNPAHGPSWVLTETV
jgi:hypothetical protein